MNHVKFDKQTMHFFTLLTDPRRINAHIDAVIRRLCSYLQYMGFVKFAKALTILQGLQELNLA